MKKQINKIFAYSIDDEYIVCSCKVNENYINILRESIQRNNASCDILHKFDNMLGSNTLIDLSFIKEDLVKDMETVSYLTTKFLDSLEIIDSKKSSWNDISLELMHAQKGTFTYDRDRNKKYNQYKSALNNNEIINTIGYDFKNRNRKRLIKSKNKNNKTKVLVIS